MGRPTKLDAAMAERLCELLARGLPLQSVADRAGVHVDTLRSWRNEREHEFSSALKAAEARAEDRWLDAVERAVPGWQSRAWLLERRFRDRYGKFGGEGPPLGVYAPVQLDEAARKKLLRAALAESEREGDAA